MIDVKRLEQAWANVHGDRYALNVWRDVANEYRRLSKCEVCSEPWEWSIDGRHLCEKHANARPA